MGIKKVGRIREIEPHFVFFGVSLSVCSVPSVVKGIFEWLPFFVCLVCFVVKNPSSRAVQISGPVVTAAVDRSFVHGTDGIARKNSVETHIMAEYLPPGPLAPALASPGRGRGRPAGRLRQAMVAWRSRSRQHLRQEYSPMQDRRRPQLVP